MGSKVRCPACGAKNDASSHRCRMCTVVINADAPAATAAELEVEVAPVADHFDAAVIDRQLQPTRSKFGDDAGGLAARLAAARAAKAANPSIPASPTTGSTGATPSGTPGTGLATGAHSAPPPSSMPSVGSPAERDLERFEPVDLSEMQTRTAPPTAPPIEHDAEPFDPDALFRDMS